MSFPAHGMKNFEIASVFMSEEDWVKARRTEISVSEINSLFAICFDRMPTPLRHFHFKDALNDGHKLVRDADLAIVEALKVRHGDQLGEWIYEGTAAGPSRTAPTPLFTFCTRRHAGSCFWMESRLLNRSLCQTSSWSSKMSATWIKRR